MVKECRECKKGATKEGEDKPRIWQVMPTSLPFVLELLPGQKYDEDEEELKAQPGQTNLKKCECCPYHWCPYPNCPHTCLYKKRALNGDNPNECCGYHWYIPLCPPPGASINLCPPDPCPAESAEDKEKKYDSSPVSEWAAKENADQHFKDYHGPCWCNNYKADLNKYKKAPHAKPPEKNKRKKMCPEEREKMFEPPPADVCSYKPCVMEMKAPQKDDETWTAIPQPCPKDKKKDKKKLGTTPEECTRENCLHYQPHKICLYDEPCKASCFDHPPGMKPWKYPNGYPNYNERKR